MAVNTYAGGGQFHMHVSIVAGSHEVVVELTWFSPEEVARYTAAAWAQGARDAVNAGAAASLCVEGLVPHNSTQVH